MANDFYTASGTPSTGSTGSSASMRSEFNALVAAFDKLPALTANANKLVAVNGGATGLTVATSIDSTPIGASTPSTGAFTTLSASSTVSGAGFSAYLASPPAIGGTVAAAGSFTTLGATGNVTLGDTAADTLGVGGSTIKNGTGNWTLPAPSAGVTLTVEGFSGSHSTQIDDSAGTAYNAGFLEVPQNSRSAAYTTVLSDSGKHIHHPSSDANARVFTIDSNANVAYPVGTAISFTNMTSQVVTIAITADTMYLAGAGTTGSRSLAQYGMATALKLTSTTWLISGSGLT